MELRASDQDPGKEHQQPPDDDLKGRGQANQPEALTFQSGTNQWTRSDHWPPKEAQARDLYLEHGKQLSFVKPTTKRSEESDSYVSDPADPVPYRKRPIQPTYGPGSSWYTTG